MNYVLIVVCFLQLLVNLAFIYHNSQLSLIQTINEPRQKIEAKTMNQEEKMKKYYKGVAVCLFLHTPTWFQRRYTLMIMNIKNNIPRDWAIQVFYTGNGQSQNGVDINKGLQRMINRGEVILTTIPKRIEKTKRRQTEIWTERWIWENIVADRVLTFGGNTAMCSNSPATVEDFAKFDYIGIPWGMKGGLGGAGGISLRNRTAILEAIDYELSKATSLEQRETAYKKWEKEDIFFVSRLQEMNQRGLARYSLATPIDTHRFAAVDRYASNEVLAASGILAGLSNEARDIFLSYCPELKMLYPSLHDPHCFGAEPDGVECAKSICALRNKTQRRGGC